jgi:hypothetical protein
MGFVDMAVGTGFFILFLSIVLMIAIQHFVRNPAAITVEEYRERAISMFEDFFTSRGVPSDWEETGTPPSELGVLKTIYVRPVLVEETKDVTRQDEPVILNLVTDEECDGDIWNNTIRIYDSSITETAFELVNPVECPSAQYINESYVRFKVNISQGDEKIFFIYYHEDNTTTAPNRTIGSYSTSVWLPNDGDGWSDSDSSWSRYGGGSGSVTTNSTTKMRGSLSVKINGTFDNSTLGLQYDPGSLINGVSNGWYIDSWVYCNDISGISAINVSVKDTDETIMASIDSSNLESGKWYHLERELDSAFWSNWTSFDASNGIDSISFYMVNSSAGLDRELLVDEVHFEVKPLEVTVFPEEVEQVVSSKKIDALTDLDYEQLRDALGEDYRFRIEIIE